MKALVVFMDSDGHPLARFLKPGFRHCFACILDENDNWIMVNGRQGVPDFHYLTGGDFDLPAFYREQGYTVIETEQRPTPIFTPLALRNCVGMIKGALCIRSWAVTPYGLYRHLLRS
jgi:hypothetical protein